MGLFVKNFNGKRLIKCFFSVLFLCSVITEVVCDNIATMATVNLGFEVNAIDGTTNWVSENGIFALGFLEVGGDNVDGYVVGVKYNLGDKDVNLPVWTVGGGLRVSLNSTFRLAMDGRLVLVNNSSRITQWSSNTSTLGVEKASLLNNGNLVLLNGKDEVVWESFSSPTNTLLPGQVIRYPRSFRAPSTRSVSSYYNFAISQTGELELVWEHNVTYWRSHFSSKEARFDSSGVLGLYDDENNVVWSVSPKDYGDPTVTLRHLRIDRDGNLRIYSWDNGSRTWKAVWQAVEDQCYVFGSCGLYSVCGYNSSGPVCDCLSNDSNELGISGSGCKRMVDLGNCRMHTSILSMKQTVLYGLYPSHDVEMSLSETACRDYCSNDSTCIAATSMNDGSGRCTLKRTSFISGYKISYIRAVSFLKVCSVPQAAAARNGNAQLISSSSNVTAAKGSRNKLMVAIGVIVLITLLVILTLQILVFWLVYRRRKNKVRTRIPFGKDAPRYSMLIRLSFEEIKELTNNFSDQLGTSVFRGILPNKTQIIAKVLKDVVVSEKEFRVKVSTLSGTHHRNLVSLKGFCYEPANKCLIYEYIPNGSLDKWLFDSDLKQDNKEQIWQQKVEIAIGVARGLAYLHSECQKCITHGNLKLENVLLDENLSPKLTDYGVEEMLMKQQTTSSSESASERDIYMLGVMLLQIVTCKREIVGENMQKILEDEPRFSDRDTFERIARISFWCMQKQPFLRPSIGEVVKVLEGTLSVDRPPSLGSAPRPSMHHHQIDKEEIQVEEEC